ncbi:probable E3 ubiquitin-protein ligase DTX3 [Cololabis saira]|uniref:probable E3 ubiquitin-protein ligase DTX3 n=1 Tax=Cololabis saira TaxID=129043 RepID=UPI002AD509B5|nr:probable E3 ubiquitin-protein ligase DTX3 [Cololabis saira]
MPSGVPGQRLVIKSDFTVGRGKPQTKWCEFLTDITLIIHAREHGGPERIARLCTSRHERRGSVFIVPGTFEELDKLVEKVLAADPRPPSPVLPPSQRAPAPVQPLTVSRLVLDYIQKKCADKLQRIQGDCVLEELPPDAGAVQAGAPGAPGAPGTVRVTFRPPRGSSSPPAFVRQRFITFYQRTASDLQVLRLRTGGLPDLSSRFPLLLVQYPPGGGATVTGPFAHVAQLKQLLSQKSSSTKSPRPAVVPSRDLPGPAAQPEQQPDNESCPICMEPIQARDKKTLRCTHSFCRDCLRTAFDYKPVCPICGEVYGTLRGTQPHGGTMDVRLASSPLPGYEKWKTIVIHYHIPSGIQKEEHPSPGQPFEGVSRTAYLPDNAEGNAVLRLLRRAFDQRLVFTIGRSTTSGRNNMVTWNDIHHKTSTHGGPSHYGYPDPDYLRRLRDELKVKGIE